MMTFRSRTFATIAVILAAAFLAGCTTSGIPQDGRYQTHGGGWDNFRA
jgi:predicted small secreted protein